MLSSRWSKISMVCILRSVLTKFEGQNVPMVENYWAPCDFRMALTYSAGRLNKGPSFWTIGGLKLSSRWSKISMVCI
jgi:hypothetical protein